MVYPNRERALRQLRRHHEEPRPSLYPGSTAEIFAYLQSEEHRDKMRSLGWTAAEFGRRWQTALAGMPRWSEAHR